MGVDGTGLEGGSVSGGLPDIKKVSWNRSFNSTPKKLPQRTMILTVHHSYNSPPLTKSVNTDLCKAARQSRAEKLDCERGADEYDDRSSDRQSATRKFVFMIFIDNGRR